jgi:hypothetical protein
MSENTLHQKLLKIRKRVTYLQKEAKGNQYSYVSSSQVLSAVRELMDEQNVLLIPNVVETNVREKIDEKGQGKTTITYFTELKMKMIWVNVEKPDEKIECTWYGQGVDIAGEKGVGKALTYAEKYFLLKFFNIATDKDDPDSFQGKNGPPPEPKKDERIEGNLEEAKDLISSANSVAELENIAIHLRQYKWTEELGFSVKEELENKIRELQITEGGK